MRFPRSLPRHAGAALLGTIALAIAFSISACGSPKPGGGNDSFDGAAFPRGVLAPPFSLLDQDGRDVSLQAARGRVVVLTFLSSSCRSCVLVAQQVRGALDELGASSPSTIFVSTDPDRDTPERVSHFLRETSLTGRVSYLAGPRAELRAVWHAYHVLPLSGSDRGSAEAAIAVLLIDRDGYERVGFGLEQLTPEGLAHDIRLLEGG
jgi:protein SCO1/2